MSEFVLHAEIRELTGKHAKHTRLAGMVPGVFYAREEKPLNIQVPKPGLDPLVFTSATHASAYCATCSSTLCRTGRCTSTSRG
jgi:ribosomal protein L25 (general stress protein Ctc)